MMRIEGGELARQNGGLQIGGAGGANATAVAQHRDG